MKFLVRFMIAGLVMASGASFADSLNYGQLPTSGQEVHLSEQAEFESGRH
ncbi:hypothetical protein [Marinobacterium jannaschii]|nr:hypothetical protein [Marinobacterium jannaschii]